MNGQHQSRHEEDLRATADSIAQDAERVAAIERTKADLARTSTGGAALEALSAEAQALVEKMHREAIAERSLAEEARAKEAHEAGTSI